MSELLMQRRLTKAFIDTMPITLELTPRTREKKSTGGRDWVEGMTRSPQVLRLVEPPRPNDPIRTADGIMRDVEFLLIGEHDAEIGVYDIFATTDGRWWEVIQLLHDNGWEKRAAVARYG